MPECVRCGDEYNPKRRALGYETCLSCGGKAAKVEMIRKAKCTAPAYNKGAYQYIGTRQAALGVGRLESEV